MNDEIAKHLKKFPNARASTLAAIPAQKIMTARLRAEIREENARSVPSLTPLQRVWKYAGKLVGWR